MKIYKKKLTKIALLSANVLLIASLAASTAFYYTKYNDLKKSSLTNDQKIAKYEKEISKTYTLPTGEKAALLVVDAASVDKFKKDDTNKEFFKDAAEGDAVLIYQNNKLGILYRPSTKKIIKTGPLFVKENLVAAIIGAKADRAAAIEILKKAFATDINSASEFDAKAALAPGTTVIVDVTGKNTDLVAKLATELKGKVGEVPAGQDKPADGFGIALYIAPVQ